MVREESVKRMMRFQMVFVLVTLLAGPICSVVGRHLRIEKVYPLNKDGKKKYYLRGGTNAKEAETTYRKLRDLKRTLGTDPFQNFLSAAIIKLPSVKASKSLAFRTATVGVSNFRCFDINFADMNIDTKYAASARAWQLQVDEFVFTCDMDIEWGYGSLSGSGAAIVEGGKSALSTGLLIDASTGKTFETCEGTSINIQNLKFDGGMSVRIMNIFQGFISRVAESVVKDEFCDMMSHAPLSSLIAAAEERLDKYKETLPEWRFDPLVPESEFEIPEGVNSTGIVNLLDAEEDSPVAAALENVNDIFYEIREDPSNSTGDGLDYGFNIIARDRLLNEEGALVKMGGDGPLWKVEGDHINAYLYLVYAKVMGIDTAKVLEPVAAIGNYTVQTQMAWDRLNVEAQFRLESYASTSETALIENGEAVPPLIETLTIRAGIQDLQATVSVMLPFDKEREEEIPEFVANWENITVGCFPNLLYGFNMSGFNATVGDIFSPTISGARSRGLDQMSTRSAQFALASLHDSLYAALPNFLQSRARDWISEYVGEPKCDENGNPPAPDNTDNRRRRLMMVEETELTTEGGFGGEEESGANYLTNGICALLCVCTAALAAGLTMGMLSLDPLMLHIKERAGSVETERKQAALLLPLVKQHHLLLVSLLLMNAMANEALPLFLDKLVPGYVAVILSVTLVLFFGEIIPSAIFTGPNQLAIAARLAPLVRTLMVILSPIAYPIAKILDHVLHEEDGGSAYNRGELSALVRIQYEDRMAAKKRRKEEKLRHTVSEAPLEGAAPSERFSSRRSLTPADVRATIRAVTREFAHHESFQSDLHCDEVTMVEGALKMKTTEAHEVYTPWAKVFAMSNDTILNERSVVRIYRSGFSRIPIFDKNGVDPTDTTRVRGILNARKLMVVNSTDQRPIDTLPLSKPLCVGMHTTLVDLINIFQQGGSGMKGGHMALVCTHPEEGNRAFASGVEHLPDSAGLMGVVTLEDVLEEMIQEEIYDENDKRERKELKLARWGFNRWKRYVKRMKNRRQVATEAATVARDRSDPRILDVVQEAMKIDAAKDGVEVPTETTSLLGRIGFFSKK